MEEESFEDDTAADALNEHFVPIKVDREERPDLDRVYQTICQLVTGRGGWPLSAWLTPEGKPFYVGTYFPREPRQNAPGFLNLLENIAESWADPEDREEMENRADQWTRALTDQLEETPEQPGEAPGSEVLSGATTAALQSADREFGGFGRGGPKFPHPGRVELLLRGYTRTGRGEALKVATETLDAMSGGGMYDQLGGGFHRYATDREWTIPHFEKMLYDNAELPKAYLSGYQAAGAPRYARVAQETFAFVERELTHPEGGFYSTLDARSLPPASRRGVSEDETTENHEVTPEEGAYYVWTPDEIRAALDDETDADLFCDRYGVTAQGNFEGRSVLTISATVPDLAEEHELQQTEVRERLMRARLVLFQAREERPRPARDEKVLAGWNGLMISSFAAGARVLEPALSERAAEALSFVREHLWDDDARRLARRFKEGDVKGPGFLEDYAFLGRGAFDLYQATGEVDHLAFAVDLARVLIEEFWDEDAGTLYFTPVSGEALVTRPQELQDQSTPSSLGVAVSLLQDLTRFAPDAGFGEVAEQALATHADRTRSGPLEHVSLALAADTRDQGVLELTVAADEFPEDWWEVLASRYTPGAIIARRPPTDDDLDEWLDALGVDEVPPIWAGRKAKDDQPTVYACEAFTCSPPKHDIRTALDWAAENSPNN